MKNRAYQIDLSRQVENPEFVMDYIPRHADWGYNTLILYLEDSFRFPSHPEFAKTCAWTPEQMQEVVNCASANGMGVIPIVPALGHTDYLLKHPKYRRLSELRETMGKDGLPVLAGQICPSLPEALEVMNDLFRDIAPYCTAGYLHVSLDESLDLGKCSLCRPQLEKHGYGGLYLDHLMNLRSIINGLGLRMAIWGDMFYYFPEIINDIPKDAAVFDWYYYPFHDKPRVELYNFREIDSSTILRRAGLEVWAAPNNGPFFCEITPPFSDRIDNIRSWWNYGEKTGCSGLAVTSWSQKYSSSELSFLVNAAAADLWLEDKPGENNEMLKHGLERMYGKAATAALPALELLNKHQVTGNWRYQLLRSPLIKLATLETPAEVLDTIGDCGRILRQSADYPPALVETVHLRDYFAHKEWLGQAGSKFLFLARQQVELGQTDKAVKLLSEIRQLYDNCAKRLPEAVNATKVLWEAAHRYQEDDNILLNLLTDDEQTLMRLGKFLDMSFKTPEIVFESCDLLAARQLLVTVRNRKPCLQGLEVQVSADGESFKPVHSLWLLEFTADAGQPNTDFRHIHSIPLPDELTGETLHVRFRCTGVGELDVSNPLLIIGGRQIRPARFIGVSGNTSNAPGILQENAWAEIGSPAPQKGFPEIDRNSSHFIEVEFINLKNSRP